MIYFKLEEWRLHFEQPQYVNKRSVLLVLPPPLFICMRSLHSISILCHIRKQLHRGLLYQAKKITLFETGWKKKLSRLYSTKCDGLRSPVSTGVNIYFTLHTSSSDPLRTYLTRSKVYNSFMRWPEKCLFEPQLQAEEQWTVDKWKLMKPDLASLPNKLCVSISLHTSQQESYGE